MQEADLLSDAGKRCYELANRVIGNVAGRGYIDRVMTTIDEYRRCRNQLVSEEKTEAVTILDDRVANSTKNLAYIPLGGIDSPDYKKARLERLLNNPPPLHHEMESMYITQDPSMQDLRRFYDGLLEKARQLGADTTQFTDRFRSVGKINGIIRH